mmetsp:Transcript_65080/g.152327  ORF Transcript_65080/g.152327 Transcript_65080/m.152327 type:complete len:412 (-) Transcript_65080:1501-2736(-)
MVLEEGTSTARGELPPCHEQSDGGGFLHHAAQLARHGQCRRSFRGPFSRGTAAGQSCRFDIQHRSSECSPGESCNGSRRQGPLVETIRGEDRLPHIVTERAFIHTHLDDHLIVTGRCIRLVRALLVLQLLHDLRGQLAADPLDVLLQVSNPSLAAVPPDEGLNGSLLNLRLDGRLHRFDCLAGLIVRFITAGFARPGRSKRFASRRICRHSLFGSLHLLLPKADLNHGIWHQVVLCYSHLFLKVVACESNDLHAVQQWARYRLQHVGRTHEEDVAAINWHVQVVIHEGIVLRRVQQLEQRARGVSLVAASDLVHLVNQDQGVCGLRLFQALDHLSWHGTDIGSPMALDFRHIVEAAHREAVKLSSECLGNGLPNRRLADTRGAHEAEDLPLHRPAQHADSNEFSDSILDVR